jgi:GT2 family glycosyltransferase/SAM-dependent methyltransferase
MRSLTIVIATYQRRESIARLLRMLADQLRAEPELRDGVDVVVVDDGSGDGTAAACEAVAIPVPLKVVWQRNRGRAAARNVGLSVARGEIVWFLDDDVLPQAGLVRRHRESHESEPEHVLMGPHMFEISPRAATPNQAWVDAIYREMSATGAVERADRFSTANASGPRESFESVGGFDEGFTGWGFEDTELASRLLAVGVPIRFDPHALAFHEQHLDVSRFAANCVSAGRNLVRTVTLHPDLVDELLPLEPVVESRRVVRSMAGRLFRQFPVRSPMPFHVASSALVPVARAEHTVTQGRSARALYLVMVLSNLAGIAEADPSGEFVARKFGVQPGPTIGSALPSAHEGAEFAHRAAAHYERQAAGGPHHPSGTYSPSGFRHYHRRAVLLEALEPLRFASVLDVGCADGFFVDAIGAQYGCGTAGVDISRSAIRRLEHRRRGAGVVADGAQLPFRDASFDLVICTETLEHVPDVDEFVSELRRVAARWIVVTTPANGSVDPDWSLTGEGHLHAFTRDQLRRLFGPAAEIRSYRGNLTFGLYKAVGRHLGARIGEGFIRADLAFADRCGSERSGPLTQHRSFLVVGPAKAD